MGRQQAAYLEQVDASLANGDLIAASLALDAHDASHSDNPDELIAVSRVMRLRGRHQEALEALERAVGHHPGHIAALVARARYALDTGDFAGADAWYGRAWSDATQDGAWVVDWLDVMMRLGRREMAQRVAAAHCERAPGDAEGWFWMGYAHHQEGHVAQALDAYLRCAQTLPGRPMLRNNMAAAYLDLQDYPSAQALLEQTLAEEPENALAWTNLASLLFRRGEMAGAQVAAERACALAPDYPRAQQVYSYVLKELQRWDEALEAIRHAYRVDPADGTIRWSLAMLQLIHGDYAQGWVNHESRWCGSPELAKMPEMPVPLWDGQSLQGKTLLLWGEQGHGDALQFVRFVPTLAEHVRREGGRLVYCCFPELLTLFRRTLDGVVETVLPSTMERLPQCDYHVPLATLPLRLRVMLNDLARWSTPYLKPDERSVNLWRQRRSAVSALKVGLVWSGSRTHQRNPMRAVDPVTLAGALAHIDGVEFFSLQLNAVEEANAMRNVGLRLTDDTAQFASFDDTAAYIQCLDLVITVCTSVAHLAGALAVPTWLMLDVDPHWVWLIDRPDSPWYPSLKLYRQPQYRQWGPVLARVASDLEVLAKSHAERQSATVAVHSDARWCLADG